MNASGWLMRKFRFSIKDHGELVRYMGLNTQTQHQYAGIALVVPLLEGKTPTSDARPY